MKFFLQSVLFWCVLATLVRCSRSTRAELSAETRKRLSVWLQSLVRRDVHKKLSMREEEDSVVNLEESKRSKQLMPHLRIKRTLGSTKPSGCNLVTCSVHELAHRIHSITKQKSEVVPQHKMGAHGYGRRRRRSLEQVFTSLASMRSRARLMKDQDHNSRNRRNISASRSQGTASRRT